jgi:hypothetical protein
MTVDAHQGQLRHRSAAAAGTPAGADDHDQNSSEARPSPSSSPSPRANNRSRFAMSRESAVVLVTGVLIGYLVLPMALVQLVGTGDNMFAGTHQQMGSPMASGPTVSNGIVPFNVRGMGSGRSMTATTLSAENLAAQMAAQYALLAKQSVPTKTTPNVMVTQTLPDALKKRVLVTGGSGFVGSHLVDKLMMEGHEVVVADNFFTGQKKNVEHWIHHPSFRYVPVVSVLGF